MLYVYVLRSESDTGLYIGYSSDLQRRLTAHKQSAARATSHRGPWNLTYYEAHAEQADVLGREKYLKDGGRLIFLRKQLRYYLAKNPVRKTPWITASRVTLGTCRGFYAAGTPPAQGCFDDHDLHPCAEQTWHRGQEPAGLSQTRGRDGSCLRGSGQS